MKKKVLKTIGLGNLGLACMLAFGVNAQAYVDPSVTTFAIQAVAGIVIAISAAVGIWFRRVKKKMNDKLGIDENRNKEVESDDIEVK
jgi:hypothetical protein